MGFNISGIVINSNFDQDINKFIEETGFSIRPEREISPEDLRENWTPEGIYRVQFTDIGTVVFLNFQECLDGQYLEGYNVMTFTYSETSSMLLFLSYYEGNVQRRRIMEDNLVKTIDEGAPLDIDSDKKGEELSEILFELFETILGKSFFLLDDTFASYQFKRVPRRRKRIK